LYPSKTGLYAYKRAAVLARGQSVLKSLHSRPEKVIAVVSHSAFLRTSVTRRRYANADYRIFEFEEVTVGKEGKEKYELREWEQTSEKGGGMGWSGKGIHGILDTDFQGEEDGVDGEALAEMPK
jgi:hypothetical protein